MTKYEYALFVKDGALHGFYSTFHDATTNARQFDERLGIEHNGEWVEVEPQGKIDASTYWCLTDDYWRIAEVYKRDGGINE